MLQATQLVGFGASSDKPAAVVEYRTTLTDVNNATGYTFAATDIGTAAGNRVVVVGVSMENSATALSSASIGGVAASWAERRFTASNTYAALVWASVPDGATADIIVTFEGAIKSRCGIGVWKVLWYGSPTPTTASGEGTTQAAASINVENGGVVVAVATDALETSVFAWTNATERYDAAMEAATVKSGADHTCVATETPRTITANGSGTTEQVIVVGHWR